MATCAHQVHGAANKGGRQGGVRPRAEKPCWAVGDIGRGVQRSPPQHQTPLLWEGSTANAQTHLRPGAAPAAWKPWSGKDKGAGTASTWS